MKHTIPHDIGEALAKSTADLALGSYRERYPQATIDLSWRDARNAELRIGVKGLELTGQISISPTDITFGMAVPFMLRPFQSRAVAMIDREVGAWLQKVRAEQ